MLVTGKSLRPQLPWIFTVLAVSLAAIAWYLAVGWRNSHWPSGGSLPGLTIGIVAGAIIVFEFMLWPRKALLRSWRIGSALLWMRMHIWLGLLTVPLVMLHSRAVFGGTLTATLMWVFILVIASGVFGLVVQQFLPRAMLNYVPAETIYSQRDHVARQLCAEAQSLVEAVCGPLPSTDAANGQSDRGNLDTRLADAEPIRSVGMVRSVGKDSFSGRVLQTQAAPVAVEKADVLATAFTQMVRPYLLGQHRGGSDLAVSAKAAKIFRGLRDRLPAAAHDAVAVLEDFCDQKRQFELQGRLHFWLHSWLWVHLPLSSALLVLLAVHIFTSLKF